MPYSQPQNSGQIRYFIDISHENNTNIQMVSTISQNDPALMDEAWQDLVDLLKAWNKLHPEAPMYANKYTETFQEITPTPPE